MALAIRPAHGPLAWPGQEVQRFGLRALLQALLPAAQEAAACREAATQVAVLQASPLEVQLQEHSSLASGTWAVHSWLLHGRGCSRSWALAAQAFP